jgi:hypothetical protein
MSTNLRWLLVDVNTLKVHTQLEIAIVFFFFLLFFFFFFFVSGATPRFRPWPLQQFASRQSYPLLVSSILLYSAATSSPS